VADEARMPPKRMPPAGLGEKGHGVRFWLLACLGVGVSLLPGCRRELRKSTNRAGEVAVTPYQREHRLPDGPRTGWLEKVLVCPGGYGLVAKLDTGAKTSSLHVSEVRMFERNGQRWAAFSGKDRDGKEYVFERQVVRTVKIKDLNGGTLERPVVRLGIVLGNTYREAEFSLEDRSRMNYRLLLGRTYLRRARLVINPAVTFRTCPNPELAVAAQ